MTDLKWYVSLAFNGLETSSAWMDWSHGIACMRVFPTYNSKSSMTLPALVPGINASPLLKLLMILLRELISLPAPWSSEWLILNSFANSLRKISRQYCPSPQNKMSSTWTTMQHLSFFAMHGCSTQNIMSSLSMRSWRKCQYQLFAPSRWPGKLRFTQYVFPSSVTITGEGCSTIRNASLTSTVPKTTPVVVESAPISERPASFWR